MVVVIQRVSEAAVVIAGHKKAAIEKGYMILVGIAVEDRSDDINWISRKIVNLRIFDDQEGKMNLSLKEVSGDILLISQFTLQANTKKGNRPSYIQAAPPDIAIPLYHQLINQLERDLGKPICTGEFGADMKVSLINDGPVTITLDSANKS